MDIHRYVQSHQRLFSNAAGVSEDILKQKVARNFDSIAD